jgi:hypothetical protein
MKPKTFEELFAGTGIEPTKDENGGVHYNFKATLKNEPMKLYTEEQVVQIVSWLTTDDIVRDDIKSKLKDLIQINALTPIELPSDDDIIVNACQNPISDDFMNDRQIGFAKGAKWMKEQILNRNK